MKRAALLSVVAVAHIFGSILLYSARVHRLSDAGDLLVFGLPFAAAVGAYYTVLAYTRRSAARTQLFAIAVGSGAASFAVAMLFNLNVFGS